MTFRQEGILLSGRIGHRLNHRVHQFLSQNRETLTLSNHEAKPIALCHSKKSFSNEYRNLSLQNRQASKISNYQKIRAMQEQNSDFHVRVG